MNKKGFAISGIIYTILILFLALITGILGLLSNRRLILDRLKTDVMNELNGQEVSIPLYMDNSGAAIPELYDNMVPIVYQDGNWVYANVYSKWYDYDLKEWANAVVLNDGVTKKVGDVISEEEIALWYVWIPRYKYKIFNDGNYNSVITVESAPAESKAQEIEIVFESKNTTKSTGDYIGTYLTHPAFTFGDKELNGIWVGKFESSNKENSSTNDSSLTLTIKPNVTSWRNINVYNAFVASQRVSSIYGLNNVDAHMMKNTEWGAVAYLSHSKYGINDEIRINNSSTFTTGCAATMPALNYVGKQQEILSSEGYFAGCENAYDSVIGYLASTTGNITGVYDMSGGAWEYMASYVQGVYGDSGFNSNNITSFNSRYFDIYPSNSTILSYNNRILGDATGELGPFYYYKDSDENFRRHSSWYGDNASFIDSSFPWFFRSGRYDYGKISGLAFYDRYHGGSSGGGSFRSVLVPR